MPVVKYRIDKKKAGGQSWWSEKQKAEAVATYLLLGNMAEVSRMSGIPHITLRKWKSQPWWQEAEDEIRKASKLEISGKLRKAVELANLAVEDRLQNGEFAFNPKTGQIVRKPVTADTAVKILDKLIDKQLLLEKTANENTKTSDEGVVERLQKIADELTRFAKAKDITPSEPPKIIDIETINEQPIQ